ncbi:TetR/AcrR family transcriptional regulator [Microbacterium sp. STN6]|uniref:SACE_7040 family transcriptional regulator n=1 Tax=Microbacterium sp. STN6 TaxID=2995588 RepID=UPI002260DCD7|nr:TetR/AcrR family transcriptional regulator [Microbacterium sp. STN6]MCX7521285.1 TetR/AcrR family transcriptional regulator [Microbacterium sp. STN6]
MRHEAVGTESSGTAADLAEPLTPRGAAKATRRRTLLDAAAGLFARRGFNGVTMDELGMAAGVSGPAVYRHFAGKQAVLAALLVGVSEDLLAGGTDVVERAPDPHEALHALIRFHVAFALGKPDVIRVQDRDLDSLAVPERRAVRSLQRRYIELWMGVLAQLRPELAPEQLRFRVQATFGLINSTPHSVGLRARSDDAAAVRPVLEQMAWAGLSG